MVSPGTTGITIDSGGGSRRLVARLTNGARGAAGSPVVLFLHGLHSNQNGYQERAGAVATSLAAVCMTFDLAGHGESAGARESLSILDHLDDACCAYDALTAADGVDNRRVGVCGASYGAYLAALLVDRRPVNRLLLRAPALYSDDRLTLPLIDRSTLGTPPTSSVALRSLAAFEGETLLLESERDEVMPQATIQAYASASGHVHHELLAGAAHRLAEPGCRAEFVRLIVRWFRQL